MKIPSLVEAYSEVERRLDPQLRELIRTDRFAQAVGIASRVQSAVGGAIGGVNARVLHAFNLPTDTDMKRLRRQIGDLDHEVRTLRLEIVRLLQDQNRAR